MSKSRKAHVGTCRLCLKTRPLEIGHVVPAFVWRWLKKTAALPYLRTGENPNLRMQDGWKRRWFCRTCENRIGRFEKAFAENLFPLVVGERQVPYSHGPWLSRFVASVAWRVLMQHAERDESFEFFTADQNAMVPQALEQWRAFLHGEADTPGSHELHFMPMGALARYQGDRSLPPNVNRYLLRTVEIHVASRPSEAFVYVKMGPAVALGFVHPPPPDRWVGTRVALNEGTVGGKMALPVQFLDYLIERAEKVRMLRRRQSTHQREKVRQDFLANVDRAAASETFRAIDADVRMFGLEKVFPPEDE